MDNRYGWSDFRCGPSYAFGCYTQEEEDEHVRKMGEGFEQIARKAFPQLDSAKVAEIYEKLEPHGA